MHIRSQLGQGSHHGWLSHSWFSVIFHDHLRSEFLFVEEVSGFHLTPGEVII